MADLDDRKPAQSGKLMHYGMMICCTLMLLPIATFFLAGGTIAGLWTNLGLFAPIALCIGAHFVMFKMMGKSCHGSKNEQVQGNGGDAEIKQVPVRVHEAAR